MHWDALQSSLPCPESSHLSGFTFRNPLQVTGVRGRSHFPSFQNRFSQTNNYIANPCTSRVWRFQSLAQCMQRGICTACARNVTIRRCSLAKLSFANPKPDRKETCRKIYTKKKSAMKGFFLKGLWTDKTFALKADDIMSNWSHLGCPFFPHIPGGITSWILTLLTFKFSNKAKLWNTCDWTHYLDGS